MAATARPLAPQGKNGKIRYAVIGLGYVSQMAMLPAFANATENSELAALVSDDEEKLRELGRKYDIKELYHYNDLEECLQSGKVDAAYIALPNTLHYEFAMRAIKAGVHVLCEKPLAMSETDCQLMVDAAKRAGVKLMTAYRLHFEEANLKAIAIAKSGLLGDIRLIDSIFTQQVEEGNIRLRRRTGGGTIYDIGIYCINAARCIFQAEPTEVWAICTTNGERRFLEVEEMAACTMRFPGDRLATFTCSFGATRVSSYRIIGTKGDLRVEPAFSHADDLKHHLTLEGKTTVETFKHRDQFGPLLLYFSECILRNEQPQPSGMEGLADVRVIRALYEAASTGLPVHLPPFERLTWPDMGQLIECPPLPEPELVDARSPSGE
jgi:glucose-fructose oxidoreductase